MLSERLDSMRRSGEAEASWCGVQSFTPEPGLLRCEVRGRTMGMENDRLCCDPVDALDCGTTTGLAFFPPFLTCSTETEKSYLLRGT